MSVRHAKAHIMGYEIAKKVIPFEFQDPILAQHIKQYIANQ